MGFQYSKRPISAPGAKFTAATTVDGKFAASSAMTVAKGITGSSELRIARDISGLGITGTSSLIQAIQALATTAFTLQAYGINLITSTAAKTWRMPAPVKGQTVVVKHGTTVAVVHSVIAYSTAYRFLSTAGSKGKIALGAGGEGVILAGTSKNWHVVANMGATFGAT